MSPRDSESGIKEKHDAFTMTSATLEIPAKDFTSQVRGTFSLATQKINEMCGETH